MPNDQAADGGAAAPSPAPAPAPAPADTAAAAPIPAPAPAPAPSDASTSLLADTAADGAKSPAPGETPPADKKDEPAGAPEAYAEFTAPDGVTLDAEVSGELKTLAKELNLPQDQAQKFADLGVKMTQKFEAARIEAESRAFSEWTTQSRTDKEFGGDALDANLAIAKDALNKFGTPELKELINNSGLGTHPEVIRLLYRVGKQVSEDSIVRGTGATPVVHSAKSHYPNSNMN